MDNDELKNNDNLLILPSVLGGDDGEILSFLLLSVLAEGVVLPLTSSLLDVNSWFALREDSVVDGEFKNDASLLVVTLEYEVVGVDDDFKVTPNNVFPLPLPVISPLLEVSETIGFVLDDDGGGGGVSVGVDVDVTVSADGVVILLLLEEKSNDIVVGVDFNFTPNLLTVLESEDGSFLLLILVLEFCCGVDMGFGVEVGNDEEDETGFNVTPNLLLLPVLLLLVEIILFGVGVVVTLLLLLLLENEFPFCTEETEDPAGLSFTRAHGLLLLLLGVLGLLLLLSFVSLLLVFIFNQLKEPFLPNNMKKTNNVT
jgi:hypothetical protein